MVSAPTAKPARFEEKEFCPTILIATSVGTRPALAHSLRQDGYVVFEASSEAEALLATISQSRLIHILLADATMNGRKLARTLRPYRREMQAVFVTANPKAGLADGLTPDIALAKIRVILKLPRQIAAAAQRNRGAVASTSVTFLGSSLHAVQPVASLRSVEEEMELTDRTRTAALARGA
ncbi:MAG: hypothetical protein JO210_03820 [Acidobacteriaceae bacterium]|nr:hypothetical protein [Acidobacteriaceae bacterium]